MSNTTPPPYVNITGISRAVMKDNAQESLAGYNGNARPGEIVVDLETNPPTPYIGNNAGQLSLLTAAGTYGDTQVGQYLNAGGVGNIIPSANGVYSLGNATNQWSDLWVTSNTIFIGGVPVGVSNGALTVSGEPVFSNDTAESISTTGNITAGYFIGDGSLLTGITTSSYSNANVANYLPTYSGNVSGGNLSITGAATVTGNVTGGNITTAGRVTATGNVTGGNIVTTGRVDATGNITSPYFIGNGSQLTGITVSTTYGNANVAAYLPTYSGNLSAGNLSITGLTTTTGNISSSATISTTGNITANLVTAGNATISGTLIAVSAFLSQGAVTAASMLSLGGIQAIGDISSSGNVLVTKDTTTANLTASGTVSGTTVSASNTMRLAVFANTGARDAAITSPQAGMMIYVTGVGMQVRGATSWNTVAGTST